MPAEHHLLPEGGIVEAKGGVLGQGVGWGCMRFKLRQSCKEDVRLNSQPLEFRPLVFLETAGI